MRRIISTLDTSSPTYKSNCEHNLGLAGELKERLHAQFCVLLREKAD